MLRELPGERRLAVVTTTKNNDARETFAGDATLNLNGANSICGLVHACGLVVHEYKGWRTLMPHDRRHRKKNYLFRLD